MSLSSNPRLQKVVGHEKIIITGLIVSDTFCQQIVPILDFNMFEQTWMRALVVKCVAYYEEYHASPKQSVISLFEVLQDELSETEADLIATFLEMLSTDYAKIEASFNEQFYIDEADMFVKKKSLEAHISRIQSMIVMGKTEDAYALANNFKPHALNGHTNGFWRLREDTSYVKITHADEETSDSRIVLEYPGAVGRLIGPCRRGWLGAFLAPMKRGKSNFLMESAVLGVLRGRKVFVALHEMKEDEWFDRLLLNISGGVYGDNTALNMPVFDCLSNREGTCIKTFRINKEPYGKGSNPRYMACNVCERVKDGGHKPCVSFPLTEFPRLKTTDARRITQSFGASAGGDIILKKYDANTANSKTLYRDWQYLADSGDVCDIIISDYADIQGPEDKGQVDSIQRIDATWLGLKWLADTTNALTLTATQGKLKSLTADDIGQDDVSGYIGKAAHVDFMVGLSQTKEEKSQGIMRLSNLYHRFASCNDNTCCSVLQRLDCGKYILDSRMGKVA